MANTCPFQCLGTPCTLEKKGESSGVREKVSGHPEPGEVGEYSSVVGLPSFHVSIPIRGEPIVV
eukprot:8202535-Heterocapsa_arctica.AAC.1